MLYLIDPLYLYYYLGLQNCLIVIGGLSLMVIPIIIKEYVEEKRQQKMIHLKKITLTKEEALQREFFFLLWEKIRSIKMLDLTNLNLWFNLLSLLAVVSGTSLMLYIAISSMKNSVEWAMQHLEDEGIIEEDIKQELMFTFENYKK